MSYLLSLYCMQIYLRLLYTLVFIVNYLKGCVLVFGGCSLLYVLFTFSVLYVDIPTFIVYFSFYRQLFEGVCVSVWWMQFVVCLIYFLCTVCRYTYVYCLRLLYTLVFIVNYLKGCVLVFGGCSLLYVLFTFSVLYVDIPTFIAYFSFYRQLFEGVCVSVWWMQFVVCLIYFLCTVCRYTYVYCILQFLSSII